MPIYYSILFILGTFFGSFSTVLISRWKDKKPGIIAGRSECPNCMNILSPLELIPIFSWVLQRGKCRHCSTKISPIYPLSEIFMGILFMIAGYIAVSFGYTWENMMFWIFLFWMFVTGVYILYDLRYMEIPDEIVIPGILVTVLLLWTSSLSWVDWKFYDFFSYSTFHTFLTDHISAAIALYSFFFLQILIPGTIFLTKQSDYTSILKLFFSYFTFPFTTVLDFFSRKYSTQEEGTEIPSWIGGGDLRLAWFIGLTLGSIHTLFAVVFAYIIGSIIGIGMIILSRLGKKPYSSHIPFGPFLGVGWIIALTFYYKILDYVNYIYM